MKLTLTDDLVLVEPLSRPRITNAGIEIPEAAAQAEPRYGEVVEVGPGKYADGAQPYGTRLTMSVKPKDRVFYNVLNSYPIMYNGLGHFLVREHAIFAVVTDDAFREETLVSRQTSREKCPEHGVECGLKEAVHDGRRGTYCPTSAKFYPLKRKEKK
jgi:co-chaperonin GroES (HSP10)